MDTTVSDKHVNINGWEMILNVCEKTRLDL